MGCPVKLKKPDCNKCEFGKEGLCDYPYSIKKPENKSVKS
ncbi:unnamed protein product [marine sediment metagenome]|uniref:Uncharacterized protein n=1 Tax=marine sediment metagenome TaxID=412755 RepID=X0SIN2_9ZZZZ